MILSPDREALCQQLIAWSIRGVCCALPSFYWAIAVEFRHAREISGMIAGVATYIAAYSWLTALPAWREGCGRGEFGWALRVAANTRAALAPLMFFGPDMMLGAISLSVVQGGARVFGVVDVSGADLFWWTYVTTLVQGALVSVTMAVVALVLWPIRSSWTRRRSGKGVANSA